MASDCVDYVYQFPWRGKLHELKLPVRLPFKGNVDELSSRIVKAHPIPYHLEEDLKNDLERFVSRETARFQDSYGDNVILGALADEQVLTDRVKDLADRYTQNYVEFTNFKEAKEDKFPAVYHNLIHSPQLNTLLQVEQTYAIAINDTMKSKQNALDVLQKRHDKELGKAMNELGVYTSDYDINQLMRRHVEERESLESKWLDEVKSLQSSQKKEYREWLTQLNNEISVSGSKRASSQMSGESPLEFSEDNSEPLIEESFTIHLGAQEKSSHNLRLICGNLLSFCQDTNGGNPMGNMEDVKLMKINPQRIQTAMSLYTPNLSAIILTVDQEINALMGPKEVFANACRQSTDFHFPSIDVQLDLVRQFAAQLSEERMLNPVITNEDSSSSSLGGSRQNSLVATPDRSRESSVERESVSRSQSQSMPHDNATSPPTDSTLLYPNWPYDNGDARSPSPIPAIGEEEGVKLRPGDFYLTRHSNLSQVHVVCHLVTEDRAILNPGLRARDPIMQGLRNSLRTIAKHGIRHITIPLLLTGQMKPDMTISWCLKRAELVFKSVKGFLLESTTWSGSSESWNLEFLIPKEISFDLFEQISDLLSKTFRKSVTLTLKSQQ